jgi:tetratricopeptide (TPR) repeat protein
MQRPFVDLKRATRAAVLALLAITMPRCWAAHRCDGCHPKEAAGYAATAMAHSLGSPRQLPAGNFVHSFSKTRFSARWNGTRMVQKLERNGSSAEHDVAYVIGSGTHAIGFLTEAGDHLFQSPIAWYTKREIWDMAPGYEQSPAPDFNRPVTPQCLFCHAGQARPVRGTLNRYATPPFQAEAITCERCHGPAEAHLRNPVPGSIVNPVKLSFRARDSICEQCHLSGMARIPNPGSQTSDFHPGKELEDVFSVYLFDSSRDPSRASPLKVISQAQQLALSACARKSHGKLWCGSCHDPHAKAASPRAYFKARCLACHGSELAGHPQPADDCIGCHMPRRPARDGGHTAFTDHHISRWPPSGSASDEAPERLVAWRDPPAAFVKRNLGLADIEVGRQLKSAPHMLEALRLLTACQHDFPYDPAVSTGIGLVLLGMKRGSEAAASFAQAAEIEPGVASHHLDEGFAWKAANEPAKAIENFEKALQLDPLLEPAYRELTDLYLRNGSPEKARATWDRYLRAFPGSIEAQTGVRAMAAMHQ